MKFDKIHNKGKARIFKNKYLEMLTKTHPLIIWSIYIPIISYLLYYSSNRLSFSAIKIFLIFLTGIFSWTLFEYIAHRYIFHWKSRNVKVQKFIYMLHGHHHHYPRDKERLIMPPIPSITISFLLFSLLYLLIKQYAFMFFPGFILGYLLYASMHYAIHAWPPPFRWMKPLWNNHNIHHYSNEHCDKRQYSGNENRRGW